MVVGLRARAIFGSISNNYSLIISNCRMSGLGRKQTLAECPLSAKSGHSIYLMNIDSNVFAF